MQINSMLTILIILALLSCNNKKQQSIKQLEIGKENYFKGNFDTSITFLNSAINIDSSNAEAYYFMGKVNYQIENYIESLKYLNLAEQKKYNHDSVQEMKLEILFTMKKFDDYIDLCNKLISKNASNYKIYFNKATALFNIANNAASTENKIEKLKEALDNVNISLNLKKNDYETFVLRGAVRFALSDNKGAISDFDIAIKNEKKDSSIISIAYRYKGLTEIELNNLNYAESLLDSAILFQKNNSILYINRGDIRILLKKIDLGCEDFRKAFEYGDNEVIERIRENCK